MKKIELETLSQIEGGRRNKAVAIVAEIGCFGAAFSFGLVTFGLGLAAAVGCSALVGYAYEKSN
ncbi:MAG: hypothetical protein WCY58_13020 [Mariniphaga sp.]|nr:hypothetical protein [Mariniphaga sp.]